MPAIRTNAITRTYKACLSCRKRKIRCDLGESNQPPCQRCRRESRDCNIPEERSSKSQTPGNNGQSSSVAPASRSTISLQAHPLPQDNRQATAAEPSTAPERTSGPGLEDTIIRTAVTSGNDALGLLFRDVRSGHATARDVAANEDDTDSSSVNDPAPTHPTGPSTWKEPDQHQPPTVQASDETQKAWNTSKLGQMGWLRANEVVSLLDGFFGTMGPLSPIISAFQVPELRNHAHIISNEPLLCAVILMISSRYNSIPDSPSLSHAAHIHSCLWRYCQRLVAGLLFGQSRSALGGDRSYGVILALLLLCEWHPRAFHFPPDADGLGGFAMTIPDCDPGRAEQTAHERWLSQVHEAVQCSDRMSTMLVGCSLTLAHELHVFDDADGTRGNPASLTMLSQKTHVRQLVYLYTHLLADKPSLMSLLPDSMSQFLSDTREPENFNERYWTMNDNQHDMVQAWLELNNLWRSFREMAPVVKGTAPGSTRTRKCLSLVDHFTSLLTQWGDKHVTKSIKSFGLRKILHIEYDYVQAQFNAFGMQAQLERMSPNEQTNTPGSIRGSDAVGPRPAELRVYAENVTRHCTFLLQEVSEMHNQNTLKCAPVRVFMRTVAAAVLLLKTLAIGVKTSELEPALALLSDTVRELKQSAVDDVHLARHYAKLLKSCLQRAKNSFAAASKRQPTPDWATPTHATNQYGTQAATAPVTEAAELTDPADFNAELPFDINGDQWWALPFGPGNDIFADLMPTDNDLQTFGYMGSGLMSFP